MTDEYDVVVVGAGCGGLAAALFAALRGGRVLVVESTEYVGGTTAFSGGSTWIPNTHLGAAVNPDDTPERAREYLTGVIGRYLDAPLLDSFLRNGPRAIAALEEHSDVRFRVFPLHPDYESEIDGSVTCGRALEPLPFDGRILSKADFALVRPPIPEFTVLGGMMVDRQDIGHLMKMRRSAASLRHAARILSRHLRDRLRYPRGTRLVMGNALVARFLHSLRTRGVHVWTRAAVAALHPVAAAGIDVEVDREGRRYRVRATRAVVLATGGFNRNAALRKERLGDIAPHSPTAPGNAGGGILLAQALGGRMGSDGYEPVLWAPVSARTRKDGSTAVFPHFIMDRGKPGTMVVDRSGRRFLNETLSYHRFGHAMREASATRPSIPAWLIADAQAVHKYGLGVIRPGTRDLTSFVQEHYVRMGDTIEALAAQIGVDSGVLRSTVDTFNGYAVDGVDREFGRGSTIYQRNIGDATVTPNPTYGPLVHAPFHAVQISPGDIGASSGLVTDANAQVLDRENRPIACLYAVGNDMHSVMRGTYPGPGITLGPAIAFAYAAVTHAFDGARASQPSQDHAAAI